MVQMILGFRPCPAATATPMAVSTMSATTATGGRPRRAVAATPTAGACTTTTTTCTRTASTWATVFLCVVERTEARCGYRIAPMLAAKRQLVYLGEAKHRAVFDYIDNVGIGDCFSVTRRKAGREKNWILIDTFRVTQGGIP